jgi:hypothetical protein
MKNYINTRVFLFLWPLSFLFNIITFLIIRYKLGGNSESSMALKYNIISGVEWFGKGQNLYLIPIVGFFIFVINFILFRSLRNAEPFLSILTTSATLVVQIILLFGILFLMRVN